MIEYKYNFKVDDVAPFIDYCESQGYELLSRETQNRVVYECESNRNIISRITKSIVAGETRTVWDFKKVDNKSTRLKESVESKEMQIDGCREIVESMLSIMRFEKTADNTRDRVVYKKDNVIFEIDKYISPKMNVVAIEGDKVSVDNLCTLITNDKDLKSHILDC